MMNGLDEFQKIGQQGMDTTMRSIGEWNKGWQAIASEMTDYTKRSFEEGTAALEKLASAKSIEQAVAIQTDYARRAYEDYMAQFSRIAGIYSETAREAYKPVEKVFDRTR